MVELYGRDGGEFVVNGNTAGFQGQPATARLASGEVIIVWTSFVSAGVFELRGQLYSADGALIGGDFPVTTLTGNLGDPRVEALSTGGFVVTWTYDLHDGTGTNAAAGTAFRIHGQIFDSAAAKLGGELTLTSGTLIDDRDSQPVALANGGFAVSFTRGTSTNNVVDNDVVVQLFDSAGVAISAATPISVSSAGNQITPSLAALAGGGFVATWQGPDPSGIGIKAQLFDSAGAKLGGELLVNTVTTSSQYQPTVAALASGGFVIAWSHLNPGVGNPDGNDIRAQIFSAAGAKVGGEFVANSATFDQQSSPFAAGLSDGGFVVGWRDQSAGQGDVSAQAFDSSGARRGIQFLLNTEVEGHQGAVALVGLADGGFAAAWGGGDADGSGVRAQFFAVGAGAPTDIALSSEALSENAIENVAVATLSAAGAANTNFTYQLIADSTGGAFRIDGDKLVVDDNARLDFESAPQATVTVRATDLNGQSYDEIFVLDVIDIDHEKRYSAGGEQIVNVNQSGGQGGAATVALAGGGFAVTWTEYDPQPGDSTPERTLLRLYDSTGEPTSGEIVLADKGHYFSSLTPLANGGFLAARTAWGEPSGVYGVKAQAYDSAGNPSGPALAAAGPPHSFAGEPAAIELSTGGFVMIFTLARPSETPPSFGLQGQRFTADGTPTGPRFGFGADLTGTPFGLVATPEGGFAVSWIADEEVPGEAKVWFFDSAGAPSGAPLSVELGLDPGTLTLTALAGGGYALTWRELVAEGESDLTLQAVMAQLIGPDGAADGEPFILAAYVAHHDAGEVTFAAHPDGGFVATWPLIGVEGEEIIYGVQGQLFDGLGRPVGEPFQATTMGYGSDVTVLADGSIVTLWQGSDADQYGIFSRVYRPANEPAIDPGTDDVLTGDEQANRLDGMNGNDQLYGLGGNDELIGGAGNDLLSGGTGFNSVDGGGGDDVINSVNLGVDTIVGGSGNDVAV
ncbi:MAG TPA: hypothetical protein VGB04_01090, partial [Allosphingosinicella sp.]